MNRRIVLITGVSGSGKTTLQDFMIKNGWIKPINFTTRKPRNENELDEYVFLTKEQYFTKLKNGDFLEHTNYNGNWYGVSNTIPKEGNICIILDPVGRAMAIEYFIRNNINYESYYLDINSYIQVERLIKRGDEKPKSRMNDFLWFSPTPNCTILDGRMEAEFLYKLIKK